MRIVFYGASVTQQSKNQGGEITGYVPKVIDNLKVLGNDCDYVQMGFGSCHLDDAGFINYQKVIHENPDLIVFEWHTTGLGRFHEQKFGKIIREFTKQCKVLILILPIERYVNQPTRDNIKQARAYQSENCKILDLYPYYSKSMLRDGVHTNAIGAKDYADLIAPVLFKYINGFQLRRDDGEQIAKPSSIETYSVSEYRSTIQVRTGQKLIITIKCAKKEKVQLYADLRLGPNSPVIEAVCRNQIQEIKILDAWCHYNRTCIKPLTRNFDLTEGTYKIELKIDTNRTAIHFSELQENYPKLKISNKELCLDVVGSVYLVNGEIIDVLLEDMNIERHQLGQKVNSAETIVLFRQGGNNKRIGNCLVWLESAWQWCVDNGVKFYFPQAKYVFDGLLDESTLKLLNLELDNKTTFGTNSEFTSSLLQGMCVAATKHAVIDASLGCKTLTLMPGLLGYIQPSGIDWEENNGRILDYIKKFECVIVDEPFPFKYKSSNRSEWLKLSDICLSFMEEVTNRGIFVTVHVRQGDYKRWQNGKYYKDNDFYNTLLKELLALTANTDKGAICVVHNGSFIIDEAIKNDLVCFDESSLTPEIRDFLTLACSKNVTGPLSTFTIQAANVASKVKYRKPTIHVFDSNSTVAEVINKIKMC
jgi:hypothetical protein